MNKYSLLLHVLQYGFCLWYHFIMIEGSLVERTETEQGLASPVVGVARQAGEIVMELRKQGLAEEWKTEGTVATKADKEAEVLIKEELLKIKECSFFGEEEGGEVDKEGYQWVVDPVDGTENLTGFPPVFGISIGLLKEGVPYLGVIYDPVHKRVFASEEGKGAWVEGLETGERRELRVSEVANPEMARVGCDFSSRSETNDQVMAILSQIHDTGRRAVKVVGAPVLSLAAISEGKLDVFFRPTRTSKLPDLVAGVSLVREAGGAVKDFNMNEWTVDSGSIVVGNRSLLEKYQKCFN
jgi:fructose-1,6-bisphosphatase/inositol monophosphatase family enzyme